MSNEFKLGHVYYASPAMREHKREIIVPIGRIDEDMQFALIKGIRSGRVTRVDGREFVKFDTEIGTYTASSFCEADGADAAIINDILMRGKSYVH